MSLTGPQTTPFAPANAQPRVVITPGTDFTLDLTPQSAPFSSITLRCFFRLLAAFAG